MNVGILDHESLRLGGGQLVVAHMAEDLSTEHRVEIVHTGRGYDVDSLAAAFDLDLTRVRERLCALPRSFAVPGPHSAARWLFGVPREEVELTGRYDLFVYVGHGIPPYSKASHSLVYCHFPFESAPGPESLTNRPGRRRMSTLERSIRLRAYRWIWTRRMRTYDAVLANSRFTSDWIGRRWGVDATVLYPPVALDGVDRMKDGTKERRVVSVGRFVSSDHKKLGLQLEAFERFLEGVSSDWRLVLIGFCADLPEDVAFVEALRERARQLPVDVMVNATRVELKEQLARATLYWHTTGLGDASQELPPGKMEHFGIATVEAMAHGCVPVVPSVGGPAEIVRHGIDGFLCDDPEQLVASSIAVANDPGLRDRLSEGARARSRCFSVERFEESFGQQIQRLSGHTSA